MKLLAFVDTHEAPDALSRLKAIVERERPDVAVCAGDFTVFGKSTRRMLKEMDGFGIPVVLVHGNHEDEDEVLQLHKEFANLHFAHGRAIDVAGLRFIGFGGHGFHRREAELERMEERLRHEFHERTVFVSHAPPYATRLDEVDDDWHVGNESLRELIVRRLPMLVICGHIHQCFHRRDKVLTTTVVNPGPEGELIEVDL